ncbi:MAG: SAM-dependent methyltransferase [Cyanobacteria bacterium J06648_11]
MPWGRSFAEYTIMFGLTDRELDRAIVDCGGGPASFNAALTQQGGRVTSCDPLYRCETGQIRQQVEVTFAQILEQVKCNRDRYVWRDIASPEHLGETRMQAMSAFLDDYDRGKQEGRYVVGALPDLPFAPRQFELGLCSHFLFTYGDRFSLDFHVAAMLDMLRVATEIRVFPLVDLSGQPSPLLDPARQALCDVGYQSDVMKTAYEFQRGGNHFLRVSGIPSREILSERSLKWETAK